MDDEEMAGRERSDSDAKTEPDSDAKTEQEIFDEQIARASGKAVVMVGGVGILLSVVLSTVALVISASHHGKTITVQAAAPVTQTATTQPTTPPLAGDALGAQLFISGKPDVGAIGCGSCHTMKAAGASGTIGPNLDRELTADPASATRESIVDPNKEIVPGYSANVMPTNYGTAFTKPELAALVNYVYRSTNTKARRAALKGSTTP